MITFCNLQHTLKFLTIRCAKILIITCSFWASAKQKTNAFIHVIKRSEVYKLTILYKLKKFIFLLQSLESVWLHCNICILQIFLNSPMAIKFYISSKTNNVLLLKFSSITSFLNIHIFDKLMLCCFFLTKLYY